MKESTLVITEDNTADVSSDDLLPLARSLKDEGFRFITMSSVDLGESISVFYHLDKDLQMRNLRVDVPKGGKIQSVSLVFSCACLVENEIKEHFGVDFHGLPIDFQGMLYLDEEVQKTPFCKIGVTRI
jgi:ech hydrogenase subunit D